MATVSVSFNFDRQTEEAFTFYKSIFGGEFEAPGMMRMTDMPAQEGAPAPSEADKNLVIHVSLPILGGVRIMGTDMAAMMGAITKGNNVYIALHPDTRTECDRLFKALSEGGTVEMPLAEAFWGDYYGTCIDKFGIRWMFDTASKT
ncbi:MAG: VOC family protein [Minisyncoccia bacterium]